MKGNNMKVIIWSRYNCPQCEQAKSLLKQKGLQYEERKIGDGWMKEELLEVAPNAKSVPQIFIDNQHVGGLTELKQRLAA
jgi:glutaredoxin 3